MYSSFVYYYTNKEGNHAKSVQPPTDIDLNKTIMRLPKDNTNAFPTLDIEEDFVQLANDFPSEDFVMINSTNNANDKCIYHYTNKNGDRVISNHVENIDMNRSIFGKLC